MKPDTPRRVFIPPGSVMVLDFLAATLRLTSEQTGGAYYLFRTDFDPGTGNGLHVHRGEDEMGYVLEGALEIRLSDHTAILEAGGVAHMPKGIPHAIRNPLATPSRDLFMTVPGGLDRWFDALADAKDRGALDDETYRKLSEDF